MSKFVITLFFRKLTTFFRTKEKVYFKGFCITTKRISYAACEDGITKQDVKRAGYSSREELLAELNTRTEGKLYRNALRYGGADPRIGLRRRDDLSDDDIESVKSRLANMDVRSRHGRWTATTLRLIAKTPGERAANLAESVGMETKRFKTNVRKLKELGLTESLEVGYRLSPRGRVVLDRI